MAKFDPFLSPRPPPWRNPRKGRGKILQRNGAIVLQAQRAKQIQSKNLTLVIWQPCQIWTKQLTRLRSILQPSNDGDYGGVRVHVDIGAVESDGDIAFDGVAFERIPDDPVAAQSSPPDIEYVAYIVSYM